MPSLRVRGERTGSSSPHMPKKKKLTKTLTRREYYSPEREHVSYSQIKDFLASPELFYRRHVLKDLPFEDTPQVRIGKTVDALLSEEPLPYELKVLKRDNPTLFEYQKTLPDDAFMSQTEFDTANAIATRMSIQPFMEELRSNKFTEYQYPLERTVHGMPTCGLADVVIRDPKAPLLADFKVTNQDAAKSPRSWFYKCLDMNYFMQLGHYQRMLALELSLPDHAIIPVYHLIGYLSSSKLPVALIYRIPQEYLDKGNRAFEDGVKALIGAIKIGPQAFEPAPQTFKDAPALYPDERPWQF